MTLSAARLIVGLVEIYVICGAAFAVPFVVRGVGRIDPMAAAAPLAFRLLIVPGAIVFWPLLLVRWAAGSMAPPLEVNAHRRAAR